MNEFKVRKLNFTAYKMIVCHGKVDNGSNSKTVNIHVNKNHMLQQYNKE